MSAGVAVLGLAAASTFIFQSDRSLARARATVRAFDLKAQEASTAIADGRAAVQAYVAAGQGVEIWMPKVGSLMDNARVAVDQLRVMASTAPGRAALMEAEATVKEFSNVDRRARDYLRSGQPLMASDVVFAEGSETAGNAARLVETARQAELASFDQRQATARSAQAAAAAAAAALTAIVMLLFAFPKQTSEEQPVSVPTEPPAQDSNSLPVTPPIPSRASVPALKAAASLCTDFARVKDVDDLGSILGRAANAIDATGLILWLGNAKGADLRPVLAHGYAPQALARLPAVPRNGNNAAAAAYRAGTMQIVLAQPGHSNGAVVAPLLSPDGCIGALAAELRSGGEASDAAQALTAIFAAQLVSVLAPPPESGESAGRNTADHVGRVASA
jgi:hypothetical protein